MFAHYFHLALRSFKRNRVLTALMVLAIALGIGAAMTTLTTFHVLSGDPIPQKSDKLFYVRLDSVSMQGYLPGQDPDWQLTRFDAEELLRQKQGDRQAMMSAGRANVEPTKTGLSPFQIQSRHASADFFPMFDVPFAYGSGWTAADDEARAQVVVLSKELNDKLFDGDNSVGQTLRVDQKDYRVVGVLQYWRPTPHFYDVGGNVYSEVEQLFVPFSTAVTNKLARNGSVNCWGESDVDGPEGLNAPCTWIQYWVELDTPAKAADYRRYLNNYSDQQRSAGRFERPSNTRLDDVMQWLEFRQAVPSDVRIQTWLAFGFLLVCLFNTVGLLLAKFMRRSGEIGVRRALGAPRRAIFAQVLTEAGTIGLAGGILGLALAELGLWAVRQQSEEMAALVYLDSSMLLMTFALAVVASLLAGLLPAWRAMRISPSMQLKTQ
jgi:putative ABC transport system permease protein